MQWRFWLGMTSVVLGACVRTKPMARAVLPSEAIAQARQCTAQGAPQQGLGPLGAAMCQRMQRAHAPQAVGEAGDGALVDAWVSTWDAAGRPKQAREQVARCQKPDAMALLLDVALADAQGDWPQAIALAERRERLAKTDPLQPQLALRHALALMHLGRTFEAQQELVASLQQAPTHPGLRLALAQTALAQNEPARVVEILWPLLDAPQAPSAAVLLRARALVQAAREAAVAPLTPADAVEHADLLRLTQSADLSADDVAHVRRLAAQSLQPQLYPWCAMVLHKRGDVAQARSLLERAQQALALDATAPRLLAVHRLASDDLDGALLSLLEAVRRDPFDEESQGMLANVATRVGAWRHAQAAFEALTRLAPDNDAYRAGLQHARAAEASAQPAAGAK